jgi:hypothetical protein
MFDRMRLDALPKRRTTAGGSICPNSSVLGKFASKKAETASGVVRRPFSGIWRPPPATARPFRPRTPPGKPGEKEKQELGILKTERFLKNRALE